MLSTFLLLLLLSLLLHSLSLTRSFSHTVSILLLPLFTPSTRSLPCCFLSCSTLSLSCHALYPTASSPAPLSRSSLPLSQVMLYTLLLLLLLLSLPFLSLTHCLPYCATFPAPLTSSFFPLLLLSYVCSTPLFAFPLFLSSVYKAGRT